MESSRFFEPICDRQPKTGIVRALRPDFGHVGLVEGAQRVEDVARLRTQIVGRTDAVQILHGFFIHPVFVAAVDLPCRIEKAFCAEAGISG